ncbi:MAG TPA: flagellar motor protein MotB [Bryobacteraceae bacterium]|nr:flagellar motor protein MotB [Bryobacteraceae bacterium]
MAAGEQTESAPVKPPQPIVVIKRRKVVDGERHGGAWKVAYADFVTAMMALFIVLWLMNADDEVKKAITFYFNNPAGNGKMMGVETPGAIGSSIDIPTDDMTKLREKLQQALKSLPAFRQLKDHVEITITPDGLRIELLETEAGMFFESGKAVPTAGGAELLGKLAQELGQLPNNVLIEGHTDSKPFTGDGSYSNWELSSDRANAARKCMVEHGLRPEQVGQVRGFADRQLRHPETPDSASNRRVSVIVQYLKPPAGEQKQDAAKQADPPANGTAPTAK